MSRALCPPLPDRSLLPPCPTMPGEERQLCTGSRAKTGLVVEIQFCLPGPSVLAFAFGVNLADQSFASKMLEITSCNWYLVVYLLFRSCSSFIKP